MGSCSCSKFLAEIARWSYFVIAILSLMNSFIHLHIQFETYQCPDVLQEKYCYPYHADECPSSWIMAIDAEFKCIGRNLAWRDEDDFNIDSNKLLWRQIFSLRPDVFFDIWPPVILSFIAIAQHVDKFKMESISGDWGRCLVFIIFWQLFCVLGYGSNFGIIIAVFGLCLVGSLYLLLCILLLFGCANIDIRDKPVLNLEEYFAICCDVGTSLKRRGSDVHSINHDLNNDDDNDDDIKLLNQHQIDPSSLSSKKKKEENKNNVDGTSNINLTQQQEPGTAGNNISPFGSEGTFIKKKSKNKNKYDQIISNDDNDNDDETDDDSDIDSSDDVNDDDENEHDVEDDLVDDMKKDEDNEQNDNILIPPPPPPAATMQTETVETGVVDDNDLYRNERSNTLEPTPR